MFKRRAGKSNMHVTVTTMPFFQSFQPRACIFLINANQKFKIHNSQFGDRQVPLLVGHPDIGGQFVVALPSAESKKRGRRLGILHRGSRTDDSLDGRRERDALEHRLFFAFSVY